MKRACSLLVAVMVSTSPAWADDNARTTLKIVGMTCDGCVPTVKAQLENTEGVLAYEVSFEKGEAQVSYDPTRTTPARIAESVAKTGYVALVRGEAASTNNPDAPDKVTLFRVPLMCPAVKGLGCGGKARPFMADLESKPEVAEAWLNQPGTILALVWKEPQKRSHAVDLVGSIFSTADLTVTALDGSALNDALQDFAARAQWYRGQDVNRLSEQEGLVFTERMAKRVEARTRLSPTSSALLRADLREFCIEWLVGQGGRDTKVLLALAAKYMDAAQLEVYEAALREGFQAGPSEALS